MKGNPHYKKASERPLMNDSDNGVLAEAMLAVAWEVRTQNIMTLRDQSGRYGADWQTLESQVRERMGLL